MCQCILHPHLPYVSHSGSIFFPLLVACNPRPTIASQYMNSVVVFLFPTAYGSSYFVRLISEQPHWFGEQFMWIPLALRWWDVHSRRPAKHRFEPHFLFVCVCVCMRNCAHAVFITHVSTYSQCKLRSQPFIGSAEKLTFHRSYGTLKRTSK